MGSNRSSVRRKARLRRAKRQEVRLARKEAAQPKAPAGAAKATAQG
jgi:hypothetical protein